MTIRKTLGLTEMSMDRIKAELEKRNILYMDDNDANHKILELSKQIDDIKEEKTMAKKQAKLAKKKTQKVKAKTVRKKIKDLRYKTVIFSLTPAFLKELGLTEENTREEARKKILSKAEL